MEQLYALSIIFNTLGGLVLASDYLLEKFKGFDKIHDLVNSKGVKLVIGIGSLVIGIFKFFAPMDGIPVIGDLFPSIACLAIGSVLIFDFMKDSSTVSSETLTRIDELVLSNKIVIGFIGIGIMVLHLFFSRILFL
ncbi:MAG: hypothetical protein JW969_18725 [Spirochaetales bacterium]|nr:hypothetical protein [Spirochaetales bacterium]